jgi:hypothetical protein
MIQEVFKHCTITCYPGKSGWGWNLFEGDNVIGTGEEEETYPSEIEALNTAKAQAEIVEKRWERFPLDWIQLNKFIADYSRATKHNVWLEALPGGQAWLVYYQNPSKSEPYCRTLMFDGIGGWRADAKWLEVIVEAAFKEISEKSA